MTTQGKRLAIVVNDLQPYGSQRVVMTLLEALANLGLDVELITIEDTAADVLMVPPGLSRHSIVRPAGGLRGFASTVRRLRRLLLERKPDLVISHMTLSNLVATAAVASMVPRDRPTVTVTEHNVLSKRVGTEEPRAVAVLARLLYPSAHRVVGVSEGVVRDIVGLTRVDAGKAVCIMNPLNLGPIDRARHAPAPHVWLAGSAAEATVVCVGAFRRAKGQDILLRALAEIPDAKAVFVGDGALLPAAQRLAAELGLSERVDFVGYRSDALAFIARCRVLAVPSRWEGFGLVAIEAAALGVPVVAAAVSGISELIPRYVPGKLVAPENPIELAAGIREALSGDLRGGRSFDATRFLPDSVARAYLETGLS